MTGGARSRPPFPLFSRETAARFAYEWRDDSGNWFRSYGNENWEFDEQGLMRRRMASINDLPIREAERKYRWPLGPTSTRACPISRSSGPDPGRLAGG